jgi:hypothetical protein
MNFDKPCNPMPFGSLVKAPEFTLRKLAPLSGLLSFELADKAPQLIFAASKSCGE